MSKRILDYDPLTKTTTWFEGNGDGTFTVSQQQDVTGLIERNKRLAADGQYKRDGIKEDWYHFATIPNTVLHEIMKKYKINPLTGDDAELKKLERVLASNEYRYLRTVDKI